VAGVKPHRGAAPRSQHAWTRLGACLSASTPGTRTRVQSDQEAAPMVESVGGIGISIKRAEIQQRYPGRLPETFTPLPWPS
jgi:hypothetical protein